MSRENDLLGVVIVWESLDHLVLIHLRVLCAFLSLTFDPFSSFLVPNSLPVRSWGGKGEAGGWRERGNIFLWMFPVVLSVRKRFQASRSRRAFSANTRGQTHYLFCLTTKREKAIFNQTNSYQRAWQILWETRRHEHQHQLSIPRSSSLA